MQYKYKNHQHDEIIVTWNEDLKTVEKKNRTTGKYVLYTGMNESKAKDFIKDMIAKDKSC